MEAETIDMSHMYRVNGQTACNKIINDDMGERYGIEGAWEGGVYETFQLSKADWDYISGFDIWSTHANGPCYLSALERKSKSQFMSVDFLHLKDYDLLEKSLRVVNIAYFGGTADMANDLAQIAKNNRGILVLTLGAEGSIAFEGDKAYTQKALPMEKVIDTTGCGDAFQSAFTTSYIRTKDIQASLLAGAELGRIAASSYGGISWKS
jgi:fructoselysine 6-kinase